jgi:FixJ family two-component response regulator
MKPEARSDHEPAGSIVFVVDDDDAMRESLRSLIRSAGLYVEAFPSARAFLGKKCPQCRRVSFLTFVCPA